METVRIAILGATSHIAKGLIAAWAKPPDRTLLLYARSTERVREFLSSIGEGHPAVFPLNEFGSEPFDIVVNCIGIGDPGRLRDQAATIFALTELWDNSILDHLAQHPDVLYINFSSGAAYGSDFSSPVDQSTVSSFPLNDLTPAEFYGIAKLNAESKHRARPDLHIVDLRVFSYFSRYIDLSTRFLLSDIITAIRNETELVTTSANIVRDYVHPDDLTSLLDLVIARRELNDVYDVYSAGPVSKFEILDECAARYGLRYRVADDTATVNATGVKDHYYSRNYNAADLGYSPRYSSIDALRSEAGALLKSLDKGSLENAIKKERVTI